MNNVQIPTESTTGLFNVGTIEGILVLILVIFILKESSKKVVNMVWGIVGLVFAFQFLYILGQTSFNNIVPVGNFFKYDALGALAQLIPWQPAKDFLMTCSNFLTTFIMSAANMLVWAWQETMGSLPIG